MFRQVALDGFSLTKMRKFAAEKNARLRARHWNVMTEEVWFPAQLVFIDETSKDGWALRRDHGRSLKGTRIEQRETTMRGRRVSVLGVLAITGFVDFHWVVKGYSAEEFLYAVEYHVLPHLNPYPQHNSILVRNAVLHRVFTWLFYLKSAARAWLVCFVGLFVLFVSGQITYYIFT